MDAQIAAAVDAYLGAIGADPREYDRERADLINNTTSVVDVVERLGVNGEELTVDVAGGRDGIYVNASTAVGAASLDVVEMRNTSYTPEEIVDEARGFIDGMGIVDMSYTVGVNEIITLYNAIARTPQGRAAFIQIPQMSHPSVPSPRPPPTYNTEPTSLSTYAPPQTTATPRFRSAGYDAAQQTAPRPYDSASFRHDPAPATDWRLSRDVTELQRIARQQQDTMRRQQAMLDRHEEQIRELVHYARQLQQQPSACSIQRRVASM